MASNNTDNDDSKCSKCGKPNFYSGHVPEKGWPQGEEPCCICIRKEDDDVPDFDPSTIPEDIVNENLQMKIKGPYPDPKPNQPPMWKISINNRTGWVCPVCSRPNSPDVETCPCYQGSCSLSYVYEDSRTGGGYNGGY